VALTLGPKAATITLYPWAGTQASRNVRAAIDDAADGRAPAVIFDLSSTVDVLDERLTAAIAYGADRFPGAGRVLVRGASLEQAQRLRRERPAGWARFA
jgi:hypothetical protein